MVVNSSTNWLALWIIPTSTGNMIRIVPVVICARIGLGFVHFLYDRWLWRFSDPQMRARIGSLHTANS